MMYKSLIYSLACLSFAIVIGGAVYEHLAVVPRWSAAPPQSLAMFQGAYGLNAAAFWKPIHPVTLLLLALALAASWKTAARRPVLVVFASYVAILLITFIFFVPELLAITGTAYSETADADLTRRAGLWEILSLVRLAFLIVLGLILFTGLTRLGPPRS